jgi:hypothetical protein
MWFCIREDVVVNSVTKFGSQAEEWTGHRFARSHRGQYQSVGKSCPEFRCGSDLNSPSEISF